MPDTETPKSDADYLKSIDRSLAIIKRIAIWFLVLSIAGTLFGLAWIITVANGGKFI
jgi:hypothetical protein